MNTISVRVDNEKAKLLDMLCSSMNRSRNYLVNQAIDSYLENEAHHFQELIESIQEADANKLVEHGKVMAEIDDIIESYSRP